MRATEKLFRSAMMGPAWRLGEETSANEWEISMDGMVVARICQAGVSTFRVTSPVVDTGGVITSTGLVVTVKNTKELRTCLDSIARVVHDGLHAAAKFGEISGAASPLLNALALHGKMKKDFSGSFTGNSTVGKLASSVRLTPTPDGGLSATVSLTVKVSKSENIENLATVIELIKSHNLIGD